MVVINNNANKNDLLVVSRQHGNNAITCNIELLYVEEAGM